MRLVCGIGLGLVRALLGPGWGLVWARFELDGAWLGLFGVLFGSVLGQFWAQLEPCWGQVRPDKQTG